MPPPPLVFFFLWSQCVEVLRDAEVSQRMPRHRSAQYKETTPPRGLFSVVDSENSPTFVSRSLGKSHMCTCRLKLSFECLNVSSMCLFLLGLTKTFRLAQKIISPLTSSDVSHIPFDLVRDFEFKLIPVLIFAQKQVELPTSEEPWRLYAALHKVTHVLPSFVNELAVQNGEEVENKDVRGCSSLRVLVSGPLSETHACKIASLAGAAPSGKCHARWKKQMVF